MERLAYILDTSIIGDRIKAYDTVSKRLANTITAGHQVYLCQPVYYEVRRGLIKVNATCKLQLFQNAIMPLLYWLPLNDSDWLQAAQFWADARNAGKQLSDVDLLVAALAHRINGIVVSSDDDFRALPVRLENWHSD